MRCRALGRQGCLDGTLVVAYETVDGTATAPSDYTYTAGELTFAHGESGTQSIRVPIIDDDEIEDDETFSVRAEIISV